MEIAEPPVKPKSIPHQTPTDQDRAMNIPFRGQIKHVPIQHHQGRRIALAHQRGVQIVIQHLQGRIQATTHQAEAPARQHEVIVLQAGAALPAGATQHHQGRQGVAVIVTQHLPDHRAVAVAAAEQAGQVAVLQVVSAADNSIHSVIYF